MSDYNSNFFIKSFFVLFNNCNFLRYANTQCFLLIIILVCGTTFFKPGAGNQQCAKCGVNSVADLDRKVCTCKTGYKRAKISPKNYTSECFSKLNP